MQHSEKVFNFTNQKTGMQQAILAILAERQTIKMADLLLLLNKDRSTIYRHLKQLEQKGKVIQEKK